MAETLAPPTEIMNIGHTTFFMLKNGILHAHCSNIQYGVNDIAEIVQATGKITNGKRVLLLVTSSEYTLVDSEARNYMATAESVKYSLAEGYVITSTAQKILANFYLKFNKPKVPTRFFSDRKKAEAWLLSLKIK